MPTGYDYVAAVPLYIGHVLAFNVGAPVPNSTVTSQGWQVGVDVTVPGAVTPTVQTVLTAPQTLSTSEQSQVQTNIGVTTLLSTLVPFGSTPPDHTLIPAYIDTTTAPPTLKGWNGTAWVAIGGGGSSSGFTFVDNGDGTATVTPTGTAAAVDDGDGTATLSGGNAVDNGDGTATIAA